MKTLSILLIASSMLPAAAHACTTPPAAVRASVQSVTSDGNLYYYHIATTITNLGLAQPGNTRQFVDVFYNNQKLDAKGVPPLAAAGQYTYLYTWKRSIDAGPGSTPLTFALDEGCGGKSIAFNLSV